MDERCARDHGGHGHALKLQEAREGGRADHQQGAEIRHAIEHAGDQSPHGGVVHPQPKEGEPGGHAHEQPRHQEHVQITLDLLLDLFEDRQRHLLMREREAADLQQLAFVQIAGGEEKIDQKEHDE